MAPSAEPRKPPRPGALAAWRSAQAVCFDIDSTVSPDEGIDVLAAHCGAAERVAELTRQAMDGEVRFEDALAQRLAIINASRVQIEDCLAAHPPRLSPGIAQLAAMLEARGKVVYLVSGGFEPFVAPLGRALRIPSRRTFANRFRFKADGTCDGFDPERPTARSGGKAAVLANLKRAHGYRPLVMVGDGATDLQARPPADLMIGYGGVAVRPAVRDGADWFVTDFATLTRALE